MIRFLIRLIEQKLSLRPKVLDRRNGLSSDPSLDSLSNFCWVSELLKFTQNFILYRTVPIWVGVVG